MYFCTPPFCNSFCLCTSQPCTILAFQCSITRNTKIALAALIYIFSFLSLLLSISFLLCFETLVVYVSLHLPKWQWQWHTIKQLFHFFRFTRSRQSQIHVCSIWFYNCNTLSGINGDAIQRKMCFILSMLPFSFFENG